VKGEEKPSSPVPLVQGSRAQQYMHTVSTAFLPLALAWLKSITQKAGYNHTEKKLLYSRTLVNRHKRRTQLVVSH